MPTNHGIPISDNQSGPNRYVGRVSLNGRPLPRGFIRHAEIVAGGELRFTMQARPNMNWATKRSARPYSITGY